MSITLEVIAQTVDDALAAEAGGANRLELVCGLTEGGLTPSYGMIEAICRAVRIPVYVMIRPRGGGFVYTPTEVDVMICDAAIARNLGASGVVVGALTPEGCFDVAAVGAVLAAARLPATFHRAFESLPDKRAALGQLAAMHGVERVLTSGGTGSPLENAQLLRELITLGGLPGCRVEVMVGAGVTLENAAAVVQATGARAVHTGTAVRAPQTFLGAVSAERVRRLRRILDEAAIEA
ncbi:MAG: copper homeostasis protein [Symbiobacteriaceae bacterium]|jgi:copper homeostasis protein|nr:copper homeostasis protein [Symbiobacteriaceae bacterium]